MKIKSECIQPGMVINTSVSNTFNDYALVVKTSAYDPIEYTHYGVNDSECMIGSFARSSEVDVVIDKIKRLEILNEIRNQMFDRLNRAENDILIIDLVLSMDTL
jgi:hypothetical protein